MIFSQYANNNLLLPLSRTSPGIANTCLHRVSGSIGFYSPCKFQALCRSLYYNYVLNLFQSLPFIQLANESSAHKWHAWHIPSFLWRILLWYNLELQTTGKRTFAPLLQITIIPQDTFWGSLNVSTKQTPRTTSNSALTTRKKSTRCFC